MVPAALLHLVPDVLAHHHLLSFEQQKTWIKTRRNCGHSHSEPMAPGSIGLDVPRMQELPQLTPLQQEL